MDKVQCICCDKWLDAEFLDRDDPLTTSPIYDGLIFRSTGNFGSKVFDPMPIGVEEYIQVVICDDCVKAKLEYMTWIHNIDRKTTSEAGEFNPD